MSFWDKFTAKLENLYKSKINWTQYLAILATVYMLITHKQVPGETVQQVADGLQSLLGNILAVNATAHGLTIAFRTWFNSPK